MKRNVKNKITTEKLIRERIRKQQQGELEEEGEGVTMSPMAAEGFEERPSFRKNLTGKDNLERLSSIAARPSLSGTSPVAGVNISRAPIAPIAANTTTARRSPSSSQNDLIGEKEDTPSQSTVTPPKSSSSSTTTTRTTKPPADFRQFSEDSGLDEVELDNDRK